MAFIEIVICDSLMTKSLEKHPLLREYDGKGDCDDHVQLVHERLNYFHVDEEESENYLH